MALNDHRTQKQGGEALHRLRSDHEQFLEAYEKPTQIYRFLQARHTLKPLFLHRNLTYMQHRKPRHSTKRLRKLQVNDLIKHTREPTKPDLATEIKSDNHLEISFHGLEDGFNLQKLLESTSDSQPAPCSTTESHEVQMVEVEVLLYKFRRPLSETLMSSPNSRLFSCFSLGKRVLQYHPSSGSVKHKQSKPLPFSIPESKLTWKENAGSVMSTHMLVFKAKHTCMKKVETKKSSLDNKNSYRKNVAVALNRLNQADIAKAKQEAVKSQEQVHSNSSSTNSFIEARMSLLGTNHGRVNGMLSSKELRNHLCDANTSTKDLSLTTPTFSDDSSSRNSAMIAQSANDSNPSVVQRRPKVKIVKEKKDAAVMTDMVLGTDEYPPYQTTQKSSTESPVSDNQTMPPKAPILPATMSPPDLRDKCTSPISKFPMKNHNSMTNGFSISNSLSPSEVVSTPDEVLVQSRTEITTATMDRSKDFVKESQSTCEEREEEVVCSDKGPEMNGEHSFTVSIPRTLFSTTATQHSCESEMVSSDETAMSVSQSGRDSECSIQKSSVYKRRSEIQMLYDGDKPRGQGISADEIPMFTAEDLSRVSRSRPNWYGSSTRKITPPEHFAYSLLDHSPKKVSTGNNSSSVVSPTLNNSITVNGVDNSRKRPLDETDKGSTPIDNFSSAPLAKQPKISNSNVVEDQTALTESVLQLDVCNHQPTVESQSKPPVPSVKEGMSSMDSTSVATAATTVSNALPASDTKVTSTRFIPPNQVYCAELVAYDSRGVCLLQDGDYSLLMGRCSPKGREDDGDEEVKSVDLLSFGPLTWSNVFGGKDSKHSDNEDVSNVMLKFSARWTDGPPKHRLVSEFDTALDLKKIREAYFPPRSPTPPPLSSMSPSPPLPTTSHHDPSESTPIASDEDITDPQVKVLPELPGSGAVTPLEDGLDLIPLHQFPLPPHTDGNRVFFNFLYNNNTLQQTECRENMTCPWCFVCCGKLYALLKHMSLCHPRFHYTYTPLYNDSGTGGSSLVEVHVNKLYDSQSSVFVGRDPGEKSDMSLMQRRKGPVKCLPCTALLAERHVEVEEDLTEFLNDGSWKRGHNTNRIYFHSQSCLPMLADEINMDSEEEQALQWPKVCSQKMIDEFTDVNRGEKELMKLWNMFTMENKLIADKQIPTACVMFAQEKSDFLHDKGMIQNFMTHLICLCDFGLISPPVIRKSMAAIYGPP